MTQDEFKPLEAVYEKVIALMPNKFDSHDFVLKLAHEYQQLYVQVLSNYVEEEKPFQAVQAQIAMRLLKFPQIVTMVGEHISKDIFLQEKTASVWQKVKK